MGDRIYLDTTVLLAVFLGPKDPSYEGARAVLAGAQAGNFQPVISALVVAEAVGAATVRARDHEGRAKAQQRQSKAREFVDGLGALYVELSEIDGQSAAELSREYNLSGADALHLAAAQRHGCVTLFTADGGLLKVAGKVKGIKVLAPDWAIPQLDYESGHHDGITS